MNLSYVKIEDGEIGPCSSEFLEHEIQMAGQPEWELASTPDGYYKITFSSDTDAEYSEGYKLYDYEVLGELISVKKSPIRARIWFAFNWLRDTIWWIGYRTFCRSWGVDFYYGGAGIAKSNMFLPYALLWRFILWRFYFTDWDRPTKVVLF